MKEKRSITVQMDAELYQLIENSADGPVSTFLREFVIRPYFSEEEEGDGLLDDWQDY